MLSFLLFFCFVSGQEKVLPFFSSSFNSVRLSSTKSWPVCVVLTIFFSGSPRLAALVDFFRFCYADFFLRDLDAPFCFVSVAVRLILLSFLFSVRSEAVFKLVMFLSAAACYLLHLSFDDRRSIRLLLHFVTCLNFFSP